MRRSSPVLFDTRLPDRRNRPHENRLGLARTRGSRRGHSFAVSRGPLPRKTIGAWDAARTGSETTHASVFENVRGNADVREDARWTKRLSGNASVRLDSRRTGRKTLEDFVSIPRPLESREFSEAHLRRAFSVSGQLSRVPARALLGYGDIILDECRARRRPRGGAR